MGQAWRARSTFEAAHHVPDAHEVAEVIADRAGVLLPTERLGDPFKARVHAALKGPPEVDIGISSVCVSGPVLEQPLDALHSDAQQLVVAAAGDPRVEPGKIPPLRCDRARAVGADARHAARLALRLPLDLKLRLLRRVERLPLRVTLCAVGSDDPIELRLADDLQRA